MAPLPSSEEFTGREEYMSCLESIYDRGKHIRMALYGLSGIGYVAANTQKKRLRAAS